MKVRNPAVDAKKEIYTWFQDFNWFLHPNFLKNGTKKDLKGERPNRIERAIDSAHLGNAGAKHDLQINLPTSDGREARMSFLMVTLH